MSDTLRAKLGIGISGLLASIILFFTYDLYWWPQDDGIFAYLAEAVREGAVYGIDVIDIHGGYHTFLNAFLFSVFGSDVVVLRYPLVVLGVVNAMLAGYFLRHGGLGLQISSGLLITAIGFIQFPNAAPGWYVLSLALFIAFLFERYSSSKRILFFVGFLIGIVAMFRHPNAVFLLLGAIAYLYIIGDTAKNSGIRNTLLSKSPLIIGISIILLYSTIVFEVTGFVLLVVPALIFLGILIRLQARQASSFWTRIWWLVLGLFGGVLPMVLYQVWHGNIIEWISHLFWSQSIASGLPNFFSATYVSNLTVGWQLVFNGDWLLGAIQILYWLMVLLSPFLVLILWLRTADKALSVHPIIFLALLYAPISFYYQIPFYLYTSLGLTVIALLLLLRQYLPTLLLCSSILVFALCAMVLTSPITYSSFGPESLVQSTIPGVSLRLPASTHSEYLDKLQPIFEAKLSDGELFAAPLNQDLYFTSNLKSPTAIHWSALLETQYSQQKINLEWFESLSPQSRMFVFSMDSKYVTDFDRKLISELEASLDYKELPVIGETRYFLLSEEQKQ